MPKQPSPRWGKANLPWVPGGLSGAAGPPCLACPGNDRINTHKQFKPAKDTEPVTPSKAGPLCKTSVGSKHHPVPPTTQHRDNSAIYPSASFSRNPFFAFTPHIALGEEMGDVGHQQPGHILDREKGAAACVEMETQLWHCETLGTDTKVTRQGLASEGKVPCPLPKGSRARKEAALRGWRG